MKKWFVLFLVSLMLVIGCGGALAEAAPDAFTFERFCADAGLPYEGEWACFDETLYIYLPAELTKEEITEEMRAEGVLAHYSAEVEQGIALQVQIAKQGRKNSIEAIRAEYQAMGAQAIDIMVNGIPVVAALNGNELYAEALMDDGGAYLMKVTVSGRSGGADFGNAAGMYMYAMLYSMSAMSLEIGEEKADAGNDPVEQKRKEILERMAARTISEVRIQFQYNNDSEEHLNQINQMLAAMELTDVDVEELSVCLSEMNTLNQGVVVETTYRCGLNKGILVCRKDEAKKVYRYQVATEVFEAGTMEGDAFEDYWRERYPKRRIDTIVTRDFDTHKAIAVLYSEEIAE